jgi:hypothetical protein
MKIDEVMLGDLVSVSGRPIHVTLAVLNNWSDSIEPILLTPEILEKNGFELDEVIKEYCIYNGIDNRVSSHNDQEYMNSDNEWHVHIDSEDYCTIANCELTYVHELQNILRLCKIYKEIVV